MHLFGVEITGEHVKLLLPLIGGAVAAGGFLAGRWSSHRRRVLFRNEDLVSSSIVIELLRHRNRSGRLPDAAYRDAGRFVVP